MGMVKYLKRSKSSKQIIMFPFAGGTAYSYRPLAARLQHDIEVIALDSPGYDFNIEPATTNIDKLTIHFLKALLPLVKKDILLYGHSLGGILAYEFCKAIEKEYYINALVISGTDSPCNINRDTTFHSKMPHVDLVNRCIEIGGIDPVIVNDQEFLAFFCNVLQADLSILERYRPRLDAPILNTNALILTGRDDRIGPGNVKRWARFLKHMTTTEFPGNHFFIFEPPTIGQVARELESRVIAPPKWNAAKSEFA